MAVDQVEVDEVPAAITASPYLDDDLKPMLLAAYTVLVLRSGQATRARHGSNVQPSGS